MWHLTFSAPKGQGKPPLQAASGYGARQGPCNYCCTCHSRGSGGYVRNQEQLSFLRHDKYTGHCQC